MVISRARPAAKRNGQGHATQPYQLLPALSPDEFAALNADIAKHGILVAVELDDHGHLLDGHHRVRAWQELHAEGIRVPGTGSLGPLIREGLVEDLLEGIEPLPFGSLLCPLLGGMDLVVGEHRGIRRVVPLGDRCANLADGIR
jgi:hypothetical protein